MKYRRLMRLETPLQKALKDMGRFVLSVFVVKTISLVVAEVGNANISIARVATEFTIAAMVGLNSIAAHYFNVLVSIVKITLFFSAPKAISNARTELNLFIIVSLYRRQSF